jgi:hypothetical protein
VLELPVSLFQDIVPIVVERHRYWQHKKM